MLWQCVLNDTSLMSSTFSKKQGTRQEPPTGFELFGTFDGKQLAACAEKNAKSGGFARGGDQAKNIFTQDTSSATCITYTSYRHIQYPGTLGAIRPTRADATTHFPVLRPDISCPTPHRISILLHARNISCCLLKNFEITALIGQAARLDCGQPAILENEEPVGTIDNVSPGISALFRCFSSDGNGLAIRTPLPV